MAYFNHAFQKPFLGTAGFVSASGTSSASLSTGQFTFVDPKTWTAPATLDGTFTAKCPLYLVAGSLRDVDQIGPFAGGYTESVKSKLINPKYVSRFYKVEACASQQSQITVGLNQDNWDPEAPDYNAACAKQFLCDETYYLRVDIKGSPVLRFLTRNTYFTADAYTGCCPANSLAPSAVNPLIVYAQWAYNLLNSPLINPFIQVHITYSTDAGTTWEELGDGTSSQTNLDALYAFIQNPSDGDENTLAGLIIDGAYVDTRFQNCTFYPTDSIIAYLEPVKIYASEVDLNGSPCEFEGLCVNNVCNAYQGSGYGENIVRDLIMGEAYMQQPMYTGLDLRIREVLYGQSAAGVAGTGPLDAVNRDFSTTRYDRYYIQHNVPRLNNPTGTFDNEQYLLEIVAPSAGGASYTTFENFMEAWLTNAGSECGILESFACPTACTPVSPTND